MALKHKSLPAKFCLDRVAVMTHNVVPMSRYKTGSEQGRPGNESVGMRRFSGQAFLDSVDNK